MGYKPNAGTWPYEAIAAKKAEAKRRGMIYLSPWEDGWTYAGSIVKKRPKKRKVPMSMRHYRK